MTKLSNRLLLATGIALCAITAQAATLGIETGAPVLSGTGEVIYAPGVDLSFVGSDAAGLDISAAAALDPSGQLAEGADPGALLIEGGLSGAIVALGFEIDAGADGGDVIEFLLSVDGGDTDGLLSAGALAVLTGEFGTTDAFAQEAFFSPADIEVRPVSTEAPAPVPIPAAGFLLASGLVLLRLRRRF